VPLVSVNNLLVKQLIADMAHAGFTAQTVKCYAGVVKQVVASAVDDNGEEIYPRKWNHDFLDMPLVTKHHAPAFTPDQVTGILAADTPYRTLYATLAGTGMRIGEALGLEVGHISQDGHTISIRQTLWSGGVGSPKTSNAVREIDLHPSLAALLLAHIGLRRTGFVFQSSAGTPLQPAHVLRLDLHPVLAGVGAAKTGFHAFRRFRVTHLRKQRVPEDLLRFWIGHADKSVTDGYSKVKEDMEFRRQVANAIPLGFELPAETLTCVPNVPKQAFRAEAVTA
jgi:integrase